MANTAVKVSSSPNHLTYLLTGDGTVIGPTLANATILADMDQKGPLWAKWSKDYANQAAMQAALLGRGEHCSASVQLITAVADVTATINQISIAVDVDAVTATKAEIDITMSDAAGQVAMLHLIHDHSIAQ